MTIPDYQTTMLPFLQCLADGREHALAEIRESLASHFSLTDEEIEELLPSGNQAVFENRIGWARTYLKNAGLLRYVRRGVFQITDRGQELLADPPERITAKFLERYPEFVEFRDRGKSRSKHKPVELTASETPDETIEAAYSQLRQELAAEIRTQLDTVSWRFFERLVIDVLVGMGYGGSRAEAGRAFQKGSDEGIDGTIKEDRLGLDIIYVQAKRWAKGSTVGRPEIQKFAGALQGKRARKGVFITTSDFSEEARQYVQYIDSKIILINGHELAELMIDHNVGVSVAETYVIKKLDTDYFESA
jgi:restriction system protein